MPDCAETSIYCDDSWHGGLAFHQFLSQRFSSVSIHTEFTAAETPVDSNTVLIWPNPPGIESDVLHDILAKGAKILVFDESKTSLDWFRNHYRNAAYTVDSPNVPFAARINGNPALPVIQPSTELIETLGLSSDASDWQLAFNHPSPILTGAGTTAHFYFLFQIQIPENPQGKVIVIRDESFFNQLMLDTLNNADFLAAVIRSLCENEQSCKIALYESGFSYHEPVPDIPETDLRTRIQERIDSIQKKAVEQYDKYARFLEQIPWSLLLILVASIWAVIIFIIVIPWKRSNGK